MSEFINADEKRLYRKITSICERGIDDHEGEFRLTFFHLNRRARIADYDYSITAFRREQPVGGGKDKKKASLFEEVDEPVRFAFAGDNAVMSDADPQPYAPRKTKRPAASAYAAPPPAPPANPSDVVSLAVGPDKNLNSYLSYFDLGLVDGA
jgi:hypothetical protein